VDAVTLPLFMADDLPPAAPVFDASALQVGSSVVVIDRPSYRQTKHYAGTVTEKARIWITVEREGAGFPKAWRLRLDNQGDTSQISTYSTRFQTPEQHRYHQARDAAARYLSDQGIRLDNTSPWRGREMELARMVWSDQHLPARVRAEEHGHPYTAAGRDVLAGWPDPDARPTY
jgi:hypothetical protein